MGKSILTGITALILLISILMVGLAVASVLTDGTTGEYTEEDLEQMTNEVIDEITSYIQIKDQVGKYYKIDGQSKIEKIALWVSPLVSQEIDLSTLTIKLNDGESVKLLVYNDSRTLESNSLFEHPIWSNLDGSSFGFISVIDKDGSIADYDTLNDCSDNAYIVFRLPSDMTMSEHEKLIVTLFPSTGITRTTILEAPLPIKSVVTFE